MNDPQRHWWDILDTIGGVLVAVLGSFGALAGWINNRFSKLEDRLAVAEKDSGRLSAYHDANIQRLENIERSVERVHTRLDELLQRP